MQASRDTSADDASRRPEFRQPLAKEAVPVFAGVCVSVTDDVGIGAFVFG